MELDSKLYLHESDKAAMAALKAIPGFAQVMKAFMKVWNEQQFKILNMSTNIKLGENQMAKYYNMLPPICEKLGIEVPELYVELNVVPNAYTYGDTRPFIVMTSGLFETIPDELIPTVLAHECGHIACHHTLYTTMGRAILNGAASFVSGLGNIALYPIQLAFAYWMRCSEFSADRAAAIYDGNSDKVAEMCMRFAGYDKDIMADASLEIFMEQAKEYKELVNSSAFNKTMEFIMFQNYDHPLNAVRAYESVEWAKSERFANICEYLNSSPDEAEGKLPVELTPKKYVGKDASDIEALLLSKGFSNITLTRCMEVEGKAKAGSVVSFAINNVTECEKDYFKCDSPIVITYYEPKSDEEIALVHPGEIKLENNSKYYIGKQYEEVVEELKELGFTNIELKEMAMSKLAFLEKEGNVARIIIDGQDKFDKNTWFVPNAEIVLYYYVAIS